MNKAIKKYKTAKYIDTRFYYGRWTIERFFKTFGEVEITLVKRVSQ